MYSSSCLRVDCFDVHMSQAARDVRASHNTIPDIFERIEGFFRRLETYVEVPPTPQMMDMIIQIMVEVIEILGIVTKEINQGRTSKWFLYIYVSADWRFSERYLKKLAGKTDLEDALKSLDKLTQEEARMATAEILKATHAVDERVKGVADQVTGVDDRVASVHDRVKDVDSRVASVDERVRAVDDKVATVVDGAQTISESVTE
jgi:methyl-accepting chemotaxis protein